MKNSIKFSLVGLAGAGIMAGFFVSAEDRRSEYRKTENKMLYDIQVAEATKNDLDHKVDECIKTVKDCHSVYAQYRAASSELNILQNKYNEFQNSEKNAPLWLLMLGLVGGPTFTTGLGAGFGSYLRERREKKEGKVNENF